VRWGQEMVGSRESVDGESICVVGSCVGDGVREW